MDQNARVWKGESLSLRSGREQYRCHRSRLAHTNSDYIGPDELHRVKYGKTCGDRPSRAVDVDGYFAVGIFGLEVEQFRYHDVCNLLVDIRSKKNYVLFQQPGINIVMPLTATGHLNDSWN